MSKRNFSSVMAFSANNRPAAAPVTEHPSSDSELFGKANEVTAANLGGFTVVTLDLVMAGLADVVRQV